MFRVFPLPYFRPQSKQTCFEVTAGRALHQCVDVFCFCDFGCFISQRKLCDRFSVIILTPFLPSVGIVAIASCTVSAFFTSVSCNRVPANFCMRSSLQIPFYVRTMFFTWSQFVRLFPHECFLFVIFRLSKTEFTVLFLCICIFILFVVSIIFKLFLFYSN